MMTAADLQNLAARVQPYLRGTGSAGVVSISWTEWQAVLAQAHLALTLADNNARLQQSLKLHEGSHIPLTMEWAAEIKETALRLARLVDLAP